MQVEFNLKQAEQLLEMFGGEDGRVTVMQSDIGHSGPGLYAYATEYTAEGAEFLKAE